ncbi:HAAS signaling domain-containing protein [Promicromonospora sp. NPDC052451]|uniref:HAAS signaling domain-containing protein n=1 Tax=Promicromonospora sp. NPDC052451 TaxID=3364407 RepID=UPI0037C99EE2
MTERTMMNANTEGAYLRDVGRRLRALTPEQRGAVLDDVRAHFADAADAGRSPEQAVESLGDPATFTARVRAELGHDDGRADRIRRVLQWTAVGTAAFTGMFVSFLWPDDSLPGLDARYDEHGFGIVLWNLLPAVVAAVPVAVPARARTVVTAVVALVLTVVTGTAQTVFVPTAMLAWAALVVPVLARTGRPAVGWRVVGGALAGLPALLTLGGVVAGSFDTDVWTVLALVAMLALGVLIALGKVWAGAVLAALGVVAMVWATLSPGLLFLGVWWGGGLFLALGLSHVLAHSAARPSARG